MATTQRDRSARHAARQTALLAVAAARSAEVGMLAALVALPAARTDVVARPTAR